MAFKKKLWISYSAISSYARCPHLYYLEYEYRNPKTGNRIQITNPYLSLGSAVHETIEGLLIVPVKERKKVDLKKRFADIFDSYRGLKGGFLSRKKEDNFYQRGLEMMERVEKSSFLSKPSINTIGKFPTFDLIGDDVKLVGNVDWIESLPGGGAHIIDFKTGNSKENNGSLQLPIYTILAKNNLKENVERVSYWYLQHDDEPKAQEIGNLDSHITTLKEKAATIKNAIEENYFPCSYAERCFSCSDYERIFNGEAEIVETGNNHKKDVFCLFKKKDVIEKVLEEDFLDEREKKIFEMRMDTPMELITKELRLSEKKSEKIVAEIKEKLKKNLHQKELKTIVKILQ